MTPTEWPCAWSDPCRSIGDDIHQLDRPPHGSSQPGAPYDEPHHHDHTRCVAKPKGWWHSNDPTYRTHECGPYWVNARKPIERMWPPVTPWRVLATNVLSIRTRRARAIIAAQRLFDAGITPDRIVDVDDDTIAGIIDPVGLIEQRIVTLRAVADVCRRHQTPSPDQIAAVNGIGPHIIDTYRIHVLDDDTGPIVNVAAHAWAAIQTVDRLA